MSSRNFLVIFLSSWLLVLISRHFRSISPTIASSSRLLATSSESFKEKVCTNTDLNGYLSSISEKDAVDLTYSMLKTSRNDENKLKVLVKGKSTVSSSDMQEYGLSLLTAAVPLAVLFVVSLIIFWIYCSCLCCKCCPCKFCCRCCRKTTEVTKTDMKCPGIVAFLMGLGLIGAAIAGLIFNEKLLVGFNKTQCSAASALNEMLMGSNVSEGNVTYRFLGGTGAVEKIGVIIDQFNDTVQELESNFQDTEWIDDNNQKLQTQIQKIYENNKDATVLTCDPRYENNAKYEQVVPLYFLNLGPTTQELTATYKLNEEYSVSSKVVSNSLSNLRNSSQSLVGSSDSVLSSLNSGKTELQDFVNSTSDYVDQASDASDAGETFFSVIYYVIIGLLSFSMLCAVLGILGCFCSTFCHMPKFRFLTHCAWCGLSLFSLLIFLISIVLIPASIVFMESCDIFRDSLSSSSSMKAYLSPFLNESTYERLDVCLFQDGDINKLFNVSSGLSSIDDVTKSFELFENTDLNGSYVVINETDYLKTVIYFQVDAINPSAEDYTNPSYVLKDLWQWADYSALNSQQKSHCEISLDKFVYNYSDCGEYTTFFVANGAAKQNFGQKTCIDVQDLGVNDTYVIERFGTEFANCTNVTSNPVGSSVANIYRIEVRQLYQYKTQVLQVFQAVLTDFQDYDSLNNEFQSNLSALATKSLDNLKKNINQTLDYVSNNETGLIAGLNCTFLKRNAESFVDSTCIVLVPSFYQVMILILVVAGFAFFMSIALMRNGLMVHKDDAGKYSVPNGYDKPEKYQGNDRN